MVRSGILSLVICSLALASSHAQGLVPADREEYNSIPVYNARTLTYEMSVPYMADEQIGYAKVEHNYTVEAPVLPAKVDLSPFMPTPGRQLGRDCVGWSVAYALYSQAVARQRNSAPDQPYEIFSPRFLYSLICKGFDGGSAIYSDKPDKPNAISAIKTIGCATMRTAPYGNGPAQWLTSPLPKQAYIEASNYKALSHSRLVSLNGIKGALASQLPVILAIRVDSTFESRVDNGVYSYSGPSAGYHALVACGYDDDLQAVRAMNSWGSEWKDGGFCWIHYDEFEEFGLDEFCVEAYVIRLADESLPRIVASTAFRMELDEDLQILDIGQQPPAVLDAPPNNGQLKASSEDIYLVDKAGAVHVWADFVDANGQVVEQGWHNVSNGSMPQGLGNVRASMLAGIPKAIYILGNDGTVYGRAEGKQLRDSFWERLPLPHANVCVDIRERDARLYATSESGAVYVRRPGVGWAAIDVKPSSP